MANPLYEKMMRNQMVPQQMPQQPMMSGMQFQNPVQKMQYIMQAMRNPAQFVKQNLPNIPDQAFNDPTGNGVLQYMMNNMGVTQQDVWNAAGQIPQYGK